MLGTLETNAGIYVVLHRCNPFMDHKRLRLDGDIVAGPILGGVDQRDAVLLIKLANQRLAAIPELVYLVKESLLYVRGHDASSSLAHQLEQILAKLKEHD